MTFLGEKLSTYTSLSKERHRKKNIFLMINHRPYHKMPQIAMFNRYNLNMEHEKSFYNPSYQPSEKRIEISRDEISRERLRVVKEIFEKLTQLIPIRVATSLYGSLSKGKELETTTAPASDIDLIVYIDSGDLLSKYEQWQVTDERFSQLFQHSYRKCRFTTS